LSHASACLPVERPSLDGSSASPSGWARGLDPVGGHDGGTLLLATAMSQVGTHAAPRCGALVGRPQVLGHLLFTCRAERMELSNRASIRTCLSCKSERVRAGKAESCESWEYGAGRHARSRANVCDAMHIYIVAAARMADLRLAGRYAYGTSAASQHHRESSRPLPHSALVCALCASLLVVVSYTTRHNGHNCRVTCVTCERSRTDRGDAEAASCAEFCVC